MILVTDRDVEWLHLEGFKNSTETVICTKAQGRKLKYCPEHRTGKYSACNGPWARNAFDRKNGGCGRAVEPGFAVRECVWWN